MPSCTESSFSDTCWPLWYPAVVEKGIISNVSGTVQDLIEVLGLTRLCWNVSLWGITLMIWKSFVADCCFAGMHPVRWNGGVYWAWFFLCPVIQPQYELIEGYVVRMLHGQFFVLDISSVCSNVSSLSDKRMHYTSVLASHNANDGMNDEAGWSLQSIASLFPL